MTEKEPKGDGSVLSVSSSRVPECPVGSASRPMGGSLGRPQRHRPCLRLQSSPPVMSFRTSPFLLRV